LVNKYLLHVCTWTIVHYLHVPLARDLGILVSNNLCLSAHINDIVATAHKRAYMIQYAFVLRNIDLLVRAYLVYVRSPVEYNLVVWSPYTIQDIGTVEKVKRHRIIVNHIYRDYLG